MKLVLIGPPAAGKTRIGKKVARMLDVPFIDTDRMIVDEVGQQISEIFEQHGEAHFRALERAQVKRALAENAVVAFGGGAVLDPETQHDIATIPVLLLTVQARAVESRLGNGKRPLVPTVAHWEALWAKRRPLYESLADHEVDSTDRPTDLIASELAAWARSNQHTTHAARKQHS
jgi:shikimate kinase